MTENAEVFAYTKYMNIEKSPEIKASRWWDPRERGTIANFTAKVAIVGLMLNFVVDRAIDYSSYKVDSVVDSKTRLIRRDIQEPMDDVKKRVQIAVESVENIEDGVEQMKEFLQQEFGISFDKAKSNDSNN